MQALALIADGRKAPSITFQTDQAEFEKQLATQVEEGSRTIFIDNVKLRRPVESAVLGRTVTEVEGEKYRMVRSELLMGVLLLFSFSNRDPGGWTTRVSYLL